MDVPPLQSGVASSKDFVQLPFYLFLKVNSFASFNCRTADAQRKNWMHAPSSNAGCTATCNTITFLHLEAVRQALLLWTDKYCHLSSLFKLNCEGQTG